MKKLTKTYAKIMPFTQPFAPSPVFPILWEINRRNYLAKAQSWARKEGSSAIAGNGILAPVESETDVDAVTAATGLLCPGTEPRTTCGKSIGTEPGKNWDKGGVEPGENWERKGS